MRQTYEGTQGDVLVPNVSVKSWYRCMEHTCKELVGDKLKCTDPVTLRPPVSMHHENDDVITKDNFQEI